MKLKEYLIENNMTQNRLGINLARVDLLNILLVREYQEKKK